VLSYIHPLKALADPTRLQILAFLQNPIQSCCARDEGVCACDLETFLGLTQPTISHHMKLLVEAGFIMSEKRGRWVYYDLNPAAFQELIDIIQPYAHKVSPAKVVR
jgi:ArsR family transcriptional regulator